MIAIDNQLIKTKIVDKRVGARCTNLSPENPQSSSAVSYTHLTLPTIYSV